MPQIDFTTFILSLASSVQIHMGAVPDPTTKTTTKNLTMAQQTIDIISLLSEKTKGNLTEEEGKILEQVLYSLRMQFIEANK
ncbi:MAG: hypothetical protein A3H42_06525 [Deltaproteobacteria bacterium RIFCSPLOWO2_02_FULL_46_8]|nr:MAG: hypothetical protein A3H42_06525 [Deltaproteobacteria bacterium RIFCSPLOWO2_02_FULL_46_8]